ncbi:Cwf15/Cwc15 cell cycle control protein [Macrolepiota fuliginosa MF-IS2]|uniref:Cwf15/Cwc15 cell cycle control protein n=1 Tax=Macrolepiota fuliginosa MF-IS2 TaxID=1400762 RepID=A0A9P5XFP3_9AGAR|nr:Cwf15/Cwc15 cell cycle control protein [Macrolepiota fuliginosa MF-IS2]
MSTAHRPTWDPAQAKDVKGGSRQFSVRDMAAHTILKFRQVGQTSQSEVKKRDLRAELLLAETEARNKKRKAEGKPPLPIENGSSSSTTAVGDGSVSMQVDDGDEETNKRRRLLQEAIALDKDDDESESGSEGEDGEDKGKGKKDDSEESEEEDSDDEEDETAELLRELEKIKRERAEEQARKDKEQSDQDAATREAEIAIANPLLNLAAALGQTPAGLNTTTPGTFSVKKRWDDDLIFKNQAMSTKDKPQGQFVNDLLRTEFHKKFMSKFIKVCGPPTLCF